MGCFIIAGIIGRHGAACLLQGDTDGSSDSSRTACNNCYPAQCILPRLKTICAALAFRSVPRHGERNAHAAADAQGGQALLGIAAFHFVQQRYEHARA